MKLKMFSLLFTVLSFSLLGFAEDNNNYKLEKTYNRVGEYIKNELSFPLFANDTNLDVVALVQYVIKEDGEVLITNVECEIERYTDYVIEQLAQVKLTVTPEIGKKGEVLIVFKHKK